MYTYIGLKGKARIPTDDLIPRTGLAEINTQWFFCFPLLVKMPTRKASFPKLSGNGMSCLQACSDFIWDFWKLPFLEHLGKYFIKIGKISAKIQEIGKIKAIFGLGTTPI